VRPYIRSEHAKYISNIVEYGKYAERLDLVPCPHCYVIGCLNQHGKRKRFDEMTGQDTVCEARVFCNNRGNMGGCGRTFPMVLIERMCGYVVVCKTFWNFLLALLAGKSIAVAWRSSTPRLCLDNGYKLRQAFIRSQSNIRTLLNKLGPPGMSPGIKDPVLQTIQQVKSAFKGCSCAISAFQLRFQKSFLV